MCGCRRSHQSRSRGWPCHGTGDVLTQRLRGRLVWALPVSASYASNSRAGTGETDLLTGAWTLEGSALPHQGSW